MFLDLFHVQVTTVETDELVVLDVNEGNEEHVVQVVNVGLGVHEMCDEIEGNEEHVFQVVIVELDVCEKCDVNEDLQIVGALHEGEGLDEYVVMSELGSNESLGLGLLDVDALPVEHEVKAPDASG